MIHPSVFAVFLLFACQTPPASDSTSAAQPATQPSAEGASQPAAAQPAAQPAAAQPPAAQPAAQPAAEPAAQPTSAKLAPGTPRNLRLEYRVDPLGIDVRQPRFSFELDDSRRGAQQSAWQILVANDAAALESGKNLVWDSGKVESRDTCQIAYAGPDLQSLTYYWWKVRSWNEKGEETPWSAPARWSMGALLGSDFKALWIGDAQPASEFAAGGRGWCSQFSDKQKDYKWLKIDLDKGAT
jgi:hypothetical protein